ncbi:MAG TPA: hypothetical protein VF911_01430 [Thermoanaerobaculia bacterium]|jgi:hypothetical protein
MSIDASAERARHLSGYGENERARRRFSRIHPRSNAMKRLSALLIAVLLLACGRWGSHELPLRFTKAWVTGTAEVARSGEQGIPVTVRLRLGDVEAFAREFQIREPFALPCQNVRLLYRPDPKAAPRVLQPRWSHAGPLWSDEPNVCFHASVEWVWRVLIVERRGELPLDVNGRLVLVTGESSAATDGEISIVVLRQRSAPEDFAPSSNGDPVERFIVARSQWLPLGRR